MVEASLRNFLPNPVSPINDAGVTSHAKAYSKESEAQSFIDSYKTNWIGFQKSIGLTFSVVEV